MIKDRKLYEEVKDLHKDILKKDGEWKHIENSFLI